MKPYITLIIGVMDTTNIKIMETLQIFQVVF